LSPTPSPPPPPSACSPRCTGCWWCHVWGRMMGVGGIPRLPTPLFSLSLWHGCFLDESGSCLGLHFRKKASLQTRERELKRKSKKKVGCRAKNPTFRHRNQPILGPILVYAWVVMMKSGNHKDNVSSSFLYVLYVHILVNLRLLCLLFQ